MPKNHMFISEASPVKPYHVSDAGLALVKHFEGFSAEVYIDAAGHPTIGYGHLIRAGERFDTALSHAQAEALLRRDIAVAERAVHRLIHAPLSQEQFDALCSFTFNLGAGALQRSTLRAKVNRSEHAYIPSELLRWVYAGGRKLAGLVRRRRAEGVLYSGDAAI